MLKKILAFAFVVFAVSLIANAQVKTKIFSDQIPTYLIPKVNATKTFLVTAPADFNELAQKKSKGLIENYAKEVPTNIDVLQNAAVIKTKDTIFYAFKIEAEKASSVSLRFNKFKLSPNSILTIYTDKEITESIAADQNNAENVWATRTYKKGKLNLLLKVPTKEVGISSIFINKVNFGYQIGSAGSALSCNVDVNCAAGAGWSTEKNSVALIDNGLFFFTGTLLMNTCYNNIPYVLTALHGVNSGPGSGGGSLIFTFKFWSSYCNSGVTASEEIQFNGSTLRASDAGTDFALLELATKPAANSGIVYAGWTRASTGITEATVLSHPQGDLMKIANDTGSPIISTYSGLGSNSSWKLDVDLGTTEVGSSGAAYFDQNHRVFAQHIGVDNSQASSDCGRTYKWGGRFDLSWDGGGTYGTRLKDFLDPSNTGVTTMDSSPASALSANPIAISGPSLICVEEIYTVGTLPAGVTATWSAPANVTITALNSNASTVKITKVSSGYITVSVSFSPTTCGLTGTITKNINVGGPTEPSVTGNYETEGFSTPFVEQTTFCLKTYTHPGFYSGIISFNYTSATTLSWSLVSTSHPSSLVVTTGMSPTSTTNSFEVYVKPQYGVAVYRLTKTNSCGTTTVDYTFRAGYSVCADAEQRSASVSTSTISISPNPVSSQFKVTLNDQTKILKITEIVITDKMGKVIKQAKYNGKSSEETIEFSKYNPDVYIVRVFDGKNWYTEKLIKQ